MNPRITGPVHLGTELAKVIFTEEEMAGSTLTGRKVNGQCRQLLGTGKLSTIDRLVQQRFSMGEAEFAGIRSAIRDSLANRCKYLRLKLAPRNIDIIKLIVHTLTLFCYSFFTVAVTLIYYFVSIIRAITFASIIRITVSLDSLSMFTY